MAFRTESGFTFFNLLLIITILMICIPIYSAIFKAMPDTSYYEEVSIQQFLFLLQQECNKATTIHSVENQIIMIPNSGERISFELYGNLIRRQVNNLGHEIYLREIKSWDIVPVPNGIRITITSLQGEQYEKTIQYYT